MAAAPPNQTSLSNLLSTHRALLDTLISFLTVSTHHILYLRRLYPPVSFLSARAYNYPVRQNRHPAVCTWINDAAAAVRDQLEKNVVERVALCIYESDSNRVLERWTFDLRSLPSVAKRDRDVPFDSGPDEPELARKLNIADLEANFRATLSRISTSASKLKPLPEGPDAPECSFTLAIELKDNADRPVGHLEKQERKWIAAEPESIAQTTPSGQDGNGEDRINRRTQLEGKTHPVRRLEAGEFRMEVWVEESAAKFEYKTAGASSLSQMTTPAQRAASMSYGAVADKSNPDNGYGYGDDNGDNDSDSFDLEPADVNTPSGAMTDNQRG